MSDERWVHTLNPEKYRGGIIGWRDNESPTGWLSGIVIDCGACCVKVRDIRPGILTPSPAAPPKEEG